jgi:hypothetical protein
MAATMDKYSLFYLWRDLSLGQRIIVESLVCVTLSLLIEVLFFGKFGDFGGALLLGLALGIFLALINHITIAQIKKSTDE